MVTGVYVDGRKTDAVTSSAVSFPSRLLRVPAGFQDAISLGGNKVYPCDRSTRSTCGRVLVPYAEGKGSLANIPAREGRPAVRYIVEIFDGGASEDVIVFVTSLA